MRVGGNGRRKGADWAEAAAYGGAGVRGVFLRRSVHFDAKRRVLAGKRRGGGSADLAADRPRGDFRRAVFRNFWIVRRLTEKPAKSTCYKGGRILSAPTSRNEQSPLFKMGFVCFAGFSTVNGRILAAPTSRSEQSPLFKMGFVRFAGFSTVNGRILSAPTLRNEQSSLFKMGFVRFAGLFDGRGGRTTDDRQRRKFHRW